MLTCRRNHYCSVVVVTVDGMGYLQTVKLKLFKPENNFVTENVAPNASYELV